MTVCTCHVTYAFRSESTLHIKAHVCTATNPMPFPRKLKIVRTTLPTIAGNASTAFTASLLSASPSLSKHFFKTP